METLTNPRAPSNPTGAAPRWVMLNSKILKGTGSSTADANTTAASCTSSGIPFSVSLSIAAPPERSSFHYDLPAGDDKDTNDLNLAIIAAHNDSVLIESRLPGRRLSYRLCRVKLEYFLYEPGAGRTPSLSLLPGCYFSMQFQRGKGAHQVPTRRDEARNLSSSKDTGILRRGEGDVLVAQLEVGYDEMYSTAELCVLRGPGHDWVLKGLPIVHHEAEGELQHRPEIDATVPIGSHFMCCVDYNSGFILCDMVEESPKLRYIPLPGPAKVGDCSSDSDRPDMQFCRNLAAAGPSAVRFVSIAPRCCCGGPGKTFCKRSSSAFNVTTWTLALRTVEPMAWVTDGVFDCDELWQHPNYGSLPRVAPHGPIVSSDDPDIVYFRVCENNYYMNPDGNTVWMVEINIRSKVLLSVIVSGIKYYSPGDLLPAKLHWK